MKKDQKQTVKIELSRLVSDELQTRDGLRNSAVEEYAKVLQDGGTLDPAVVYNVDGEYFLASGFHRREAYRQAGREVMSCIVKEGSLWDAVEYGIRDNLKHQGERVTQADKARAVRKVLKVKPELSDRGIAELCGVSAATVAKYRTDMEATAQIEQLSERTGLDGKTRRVPQPSVVQPSNLAEPSMVEAQEDSFEHRDVIESSGADDYLSSIADVETGGTFASPDCDSRFRYSALGSNDTLMTIDPHPSSPNHCFIAVYDRAKATVDFLMRGIRHDDDTLRRVAKQFGFVQDAPWITKAATGKEPWYVPSEAERWEMEKKKFEYYETHGKFPPLDDQRFCLPTDAVSGCSIKAA